MNCNMSRRDCITKTLLKAIENLKKKNKLFYSEAHFQHSLAWEIHSLVDNKTEIILERPFENKESKNNHIDICLEEDKKLIAAIELKYKTKSIDNYKKSNLNTNLKNQDAQDQARYDYFKDIERLECLKKDNKSFVGFALFLTNDHTYWTCPKANNSTCYEQFSLKDERLLEKEKYMWSKKTGKGTKKGRCNSIKLNGKYNLNWKNYLEYEEPKNKLGEFKYLLIKI